MNLHITYFKPRIYMASAIEYYSVILSVDRQTSKAAASPGLSAANPASQYLLGVPGMYIPTCEHMILTSLQIQGTYSAPSNFNVTC